MQKRISEVVEEQKIIELDNRPRAVFVGDTHGDLEASETVWKNFHDEVESGETYLVFLGDYVDRGSRSKENIDFLLSKKEKFPEGIVLLLGNHDAYDLKNLRPADFWKSLDGEAYDYYKELSSLPWLVKSPGLVASHGCLPFISDLEELNAGSEEVFEKENDFDIPVWVSIAWGDINKTTSGATMDPLTGRPQFGREVVISEMQEHDWNLLIRAHQPEVQGWSFSNNVLTIFTSETYVRMGRAHERSVAIVNIEDRVKGSDDVNVLSLDEL